MPKGFVPLHGITYIMPVVCRLSRNQIQNVIGYDTTNTLACRPLSTARNTIVIERNLFDTLLRHYLHKNLYRFLVKHQEEKVK